MSNTFCLKELLFISVIRESHSELYGQKEFPGYLTDIFQFWNIIGLIDVDFFVFNILSYLAQRLFDIFKVRGEMFQQTMKRNGLE